MSFVFYDNNVCVLWALWLMTMTLVCTLWALSSMARRMCSMTRRMCCMTRRMCCTRRNVFYDKIYVFCGKTYVLYDKTYVFYGKTFMLYDKTCVPWQDVCVLWQWRICCMTRCMCFITSVFYELCELSEGNIYMLGPVFDPVFYDVLRVTFSHRCRWSAFLFFLFFVTELLFHRNVWNRTPHRPR